MFELVGGPYEAAMKLTTAALVCIGTLYLTDAFYFDGVYFSAFRAVMSHLLNGN